MGLLILTLFFSVESWAVQAAQDNPNLQLVSGSAAVFGRIRLTSKCQNGKNMVWLSQGPVLLYQASLPQGGSFEFHVLPGKYNVVVTNSSGCFVEETVQLKEGDKHELALSLTHGKQGPSRE